MTGEPATIPVAGRLRRLATEALTTDETAAIRALMELAFGDDEEERFEGADWEHAMGGTHVVLDLDGYWRSDQSRFARSNPRNCSNGTGSG